MSLSIGPVCAGTASRGPPPPPPSAYNNAICLPSGDQRISETCPFRFVSRRAFPLAIGSTKTCCCEDPAFDKNAICVLSGDHATEDSSYDAFPFPAVRRRGFAEEFFQSRRYSSALPLFSGVASAQVTHLPSGEIETAGNVRSCSSCFSTGSICASWADEQASATRKILSRGNDILRCRSYVSEFPLRFEQNRSTSQGRKPRLL